ncbi:phosphotransferase family protein [soil metagenome]
MRAEDVAERIWPGRGARLEALGGGITNENFLVDVDGEKLVLRIGGRDTELLGIDRDVEHATSLIAAEAGVGPEVVAFVEPEGYLVTRFIEGDPIPAEEMKTPERVEAITSLLHRIHDGRSIPGRFDSFSVVKDYCRIASEHGVEMPPAYPWAQETADAVAARRGPQPAYPCHNDLLNANFIDDGGAIRVVDWEYAGMGDRFFDLANLSVNHEFNPQDDDALLRGYFGAPTAEQRVAHTLMRFMSDFREAMWGVVQQGISKIDFDFAAYADEHFERLERTAASPRFRAALG